jgi:hypothetical protein
VRPAHYHTVPQSPPPGAHLSGSFSPIPSPAPDDPHRQRDSSQTATQASGQGYHMLPRPILSLLANDCGLYCHLTSATPLPFCCSVVPSLHGRDAGARRLTMRPRAAHPIDGAGTAEGALSRPWRSPTGVCAWPPRCGALVRLLAPCGHHSAPPFPVWQGQQRTDKILSASSPCKSPAVVCLAACLHPRVRACIV